MTPLGSARRVGSVGRMGWFGSVAPATLVARTLASAALVVSVLLTAGCGADEPDSAATTSAEAADTASTVAPETTAPPATDPPTTPTTTAPPTSAFPTPTAAGAALYQAWTTGSRETSGSLAPAAELDKLFASPPLPGVKNRGCDDGEFGSASCFFGNDQGGVNVGLSPAPGGWSIATIDPFG